MLEPPESYQEEIDESRAAARRTVQEGGQPYVVRYSEIESSTTLTMELVAQLPEENGSLLVFVSEIADFFLTIHDDKSVSMHVTQITGNQYEAHMSSGDPTIIFDIDDGRLSIRVVESIVLRAVSPGVDVPSSFTLMQGSSFNTTGSSEPE